MQYLIYRQCPYCAYQQEIRFGFCGHCGAQLERRCPDCQQSLPLDFQFCGQCGCALAGESAVARPAPPRPARPEPPPSYRPKPPATVASSGSAAPLPAPAAVAPALPTPPLARPVMPQPAQVAPAAAELPQSAVARVSERRRVAVLFCDVCGFTAMSEKLDPEEVSNIIQPLFQQCNLAINKYGGVVEKFIGDAIMALFGVPFAHEDDAERAALAALEMRTVIQRYGQEIEQSMGFSINMRIGLNVGTVVAGAVDAVEGKNYQVMGDAINTAARMEQNALPGHILVTEEMEALLRDSFELRPDKLISAKGKAEPMQAYELLNVRKLQQQRRGFDNRQIHFVGRKQELRELEHAIRQALDQSQAVFLMLSGDSGLGKTRLAQETLHLFANRQPFQRLNGISTSYSKDFAYFMLQNLLRSTIDADDSLGQTEVQQRMQALIQKLQLPNAEMNRLLLEYVLFPHLEFPQLRLLTPERLQQQIFKAVSDLLLTIARQQLLFVQIDDLQWCDSLSLQWLSYFQRTVATQPVPMIFCITCRQSATSAEEQIAWSQQRQLQPLSDEECLALIASILVVEQLPEALEPLTRLILERAAGNPFYIEEIFKILLGERRLIQTEHGWELTCELKDLPLPNSIQRLVMSRFDRLPEPQRQLLQILAATGRSTSQSLLNALYADDRARVSELLAAVERSGFIWLNRTERDCEIFFIQTLAQEVIYETLVNRRKRELHLQIARALEKLFASDLSVVLDQLAYHYVRTSETQQAIRFLWLSAEQAIRLHANAQSLQQLDQILELLQQADEQALMAVDLFKRDWYNAAQLREKALHAQLDVLLRTGAYDRVLTLVEQNLAHAPAPAFKAHLLYCRGRALEKRSDFASARALYAEAQAIYAELGDIRGQARMANASGWVLRWIGDYPAAEAACLQAQALLKTQPDMEQLAYAYNVLGWVAFSSHQFDASLQHFHQALTIQEQIQDLWGRGNSLMNIGSVYAMTNRWEDAIAEFHRSLETKEQLGDLDGISNACNNLGHAYQELGQLEAAQAPLDKALVTYQRLGNRLGVAVAQCNLGSLMFRRGKWQAAREMLNQGIDSVRACKMEAMLPEVLNHRVEICLHLRELDLAQSLLETDGPSIRSHGDPIQQGRLERLWGQWYGLGGQHETALTHLNQALHLLQPTNHQGECLALYRELASLQRRLGSDEASYWEELGQSMLVGQSS